MDLDGYYDILVNVVIDGHYRILALSNEECSQEYLSKIKVPKSQCRFFGDKFVEKTESMKDFEMI